MQMTEQPHEHQPNESELKSVINLIDGLAQSGFSEICSIATLALSYLETPRGHNNYEDIARALMAICDKAEDMEAQINSEAESVGCSYIDEGFNRRMNAKRANTRGAR